MNSNLKSRIIISSLFYLLFPLLSTFLFSQDKAKLIDQYVQDYHDNGKFHGTILVAVKGKVILTKGYGLANMEWNIPHKPDTKFRIASLTKPFTALLVLQQVEAGKIDLNGKIIDYLPEYRKDTGEKVTIHHLLTHTSGIPDIMDYPGFRSDSIRNSYSVDYMIKHFCSGDLEFVPGSKFKYSSSGYHILGVILEHVAGYSYDNLLRNHILDPAGMTNTGIDSDTLVLQNRASGYLNKKDPYVHQPYMNINLAFSSGGMYSTVEDIYRWDQALYTEKLLSRKYKDIMFRPYVDAYEGFGKYAYGWVNFQIRLSDSGNMLDAISHGGSFYGTETLCTRLVDDQDLIVLFCNTGIGQRTLIKMTMDIANVLYGK
jgi:CubicO group peptidase (beta-lactamase class C family)